MKIRLLSNGNLAWISFGQINIGLNRCTGWCYHRGQCSIHLRGFGLALTINFPARVVR